MVWLICFLFSFFYTSPSSLSHIYVCTLLGYYVYVCMVKRSGRGKKRGVHWTMNINTHKKSQQTTSPTSPTIFFASQLFIMVASLTNSMVVVFLFFFYTSFIFCLDSIYPTIENLSNFVFFLFVFEHSSHTFPLSKYHYFSLEFTLGVEASSAYILIYQVLPSQLCLSAS